MLRKLTASAALLLVATFANAEHHEAKATVVGVAKEAGTFKTLLVALDAAGLTSTLEGAGPFTVFAPTDAAFAALPTGTLEGLLADKEALTKVLLYHVISGREMSGNLADGRSLATLEGEDLAVSTANGVRVDDATVVGADIEASNGVVHVIDRVLIP
jgi:uncharacterized surface protein with fasciclin (FAS1) repeats